MKKMKKRLTYIFYLYKVSNQN